MAIAGYVPDAQTKMAHHIGIMARANGTSAIVEAIQGYLASWPQERISSLQRVDAGWAPFDVNQRPLPVNGALDVRCIRDAIHCHCLAFREAGMELTPELVELDEFFFIASELMENFGLAPSQTRAAAIAPRRETYASW